MKSDRRPLAISAHTLRLHAQYGYNYSDESLLGDSDPRFPHAGDEIRARGYVRRDELRSIAQWKSPRRAELVEDNPNEVVEKVTGLALDLKRIYPGYAVNLLTILRGIGLPTASAVLAVADPHNFGIIDIRAWQTLSQWRSERFPWKEYSAFSVKEFICYLKTIRELARASGLSCREVDMALWQMAGGKKRAGGS